MKNKAKIVEKQKQYREANKEKIAEYMNRYRKANKEIHTQKELINELNYLVTEGFVEEFKPGHYRLTKEAIAMGVAE